MRGNSSGRGIFGVPGGEFGQHRPGIPSGGLRSWIGSRTRRRTFALRRTGTWWKTGGPCGLLIAEKLGVSQPTASEHLKILTQAGLLQTRRIKQWTFYKRDEVRIKALKALISKNL